MKLYAKATANNTHDYVFRHDDPESDAWSRGRIAIAYNEGTAPSVRSKRSEAMSKKDGSTCEKKVREREREKKKAISKNETRQNMNISNDRASTTGGSWGRRWAPTTTKDKDSLFR